MTSVPVPSASKFEVKSLHVQGSHLFISLSPRDSPLSLAVFQGFSAPKVAFGLDWAFFFFLSAYMTGMYVRVQDILFRVDSMKRFSRRLVQRFQGQPYPRLSRKG